MLILKYTELKDGCPARVTREYPQFNTLNEFLAYQRQERGEREGFTDGEAWTEATKERLARSCVTVPSEALQLLERHGTIVCCADPGERHWFAPDDAPTKEEWLWHCIQVANEWREIEVIEQ